MNLMADNKIQCLQQVPMAEINLKGNCGGYAKTTAPVSGQNNFFKCFISTGGHLMFFGRQLTAKPKES